MEEAIERSRLGISDLGIEKARWEVFLKREGSTVFLGNSYALVLFSLLQVSGWVLWPGKIWSGLWKRNIAVGMGQFYPDGVTRVTDILCSTLGGRGRFGYKQSVVLFNMAHCKPFVFSGDFTGKTSLELSGKHIHWSSQWRLDEDDSKFLSKKALCINLWLFCIQWRYE